MNAPSKHPASFAHLSPADFRARVAAGEITADTSGAAPGHVQANLAILPKEYAFDFLAFCRANPQPCPVIAVSEVGNPMLPTLGENVDIRTDVPTYRVFRDGIAVEERNDISDLWRDDLVSFLVGCSYSFEEALVAEGIPLHHQTLGVTVPVFRTNIPLVPVGPFGGTTVVSMRSMTPKNAIRAIQITSRYPAVHGAPVHIGDPSLIGIKDVNKPDWGTSIPVPEGEIPVFWACGVTPQVAIEHAKPSFSITHKAGSMLVTDLFNRDYAVI